MQYRAYDNLNIYYFSGTGNAYCAAKWIRERGETEKIKTCICNIEKQDKINLRQTGEKNLIAFLFPTHGFAAPWIMLKFMWRFPKGNDDVLFINTKAGYKIWRFYIPGMTGLALWLPAFFFFWKGYGINGMVPLDMPHSWVSFFPPNPRGMYATMIDRCERIINKLCNRVFSGKKYVRYTVWTQLWFDITVSWIVPLYVFIGRFFLAKTLFSSYKCNSCRLCELNCPVNAIEMKGGMPYWKINCESCMRCMNICPQKSIQSWVTKIALVFYFLLAASMAYIHINQSLIFLIVSLLFFPVYWLLIKLLHIKAINFLFTYTSLTRYWGRAFAPGVRPKDLKG